MASVIMVVPPERFRDEELFFVKEELESAGNSVAIASTRAGIVSGSRGGSVNVDLLIGDIDCEDYAAVVFVGGGGSKLLYENVEALQIARDMHRKQKVVAAICLAPVILANAGILKGKAATVAGTEARTIEAQGATYTGPGVTVDGRIVTANAPKASRHFGRTIAELLEEEQRLSAAAHEGVTASPVRSDKPGW